MKNGHKLDKVQVRKICHEDGLQKSRKAGGINGKQGTIDIQKMLIDLSWHPKFSKQEEGNMVNEKQSMWVKVDDI